MGVPGRPRQSAWSPASLSGLASWYRGDSGVTGTTTVDAWADRSSNARDLSGSGGTRPSLLAACHEANGQPAIHCFSAGTVSPQHLNAASASAHAHLHAAGSTLFITVVPRGSVTGTILSSFGTSTAAGRGILCQYEYATSSLLMYWSRSGSFVGGGSTGAVVPLGQPCTLTARLRNSITEWDLRTAGAQRAHAVWNTPSSGDSADPLRIGDYSRAGSAPFDGDVLELITYDRELTDAECALVEGYLSLRYTPPALDITAAVVPGVSQLTGTVRVLCVGDSITQGLTGATTRLGGYRHRLDEQRGTLPFTLDLVGTQTYGSMVDNEHDGRSGWVIDNRLAGVVVNGHTAGSSNSGRITDELGSVDPHVVVILIGVNTITAGADSAVLSRDALGDLYQLVIDVRALEPSARIVLCPLLLTTGNALREARRQAFNAGLSSVVRALRAQGVPLAVSNSGSALVAGDLFDGLHPNDAGYQALGDAILPQIRYAAGHS